MQQCDSTLIASDHFRIGSDNLPTHTCAGCVAPVLRPRPTPRPARPRVSCPLVFQSNAPSEPAHEPHARSTDARPLALLRMALGALVILDLADRLRDFHVFYTTGGLAAPAGAAARWSWLALSDDPATTLLLYLLAFPIAGLVLLGLFTRAALVATFLALISLHHRNPYVEGGGDAVLRALLFWMIFVDAGARFSLDVRLGRRPPRDRIPAFPVLVLQLQIASIYLFAFLTKTGPSWRDGSAIWRALNTSDWARGAGHWLGTQPTLCRLLSHATLAFEAGFAPLVFWRTGWPARALALGLGLAIHLGIFFTMRVGIFSPVMVISYLAFVPGTWLAGMGRAAAALDHRRRARAAPTPPPGRESPAIKPALLAVFGVILAGQLSALFPAAAPAFLTRALSGLGLRQDWRMFAPDAPALEVRFTAPGVLADGRAVELTEAGSTLAPLGQQHGFRYSRWHRLRNSLAADTPALLAALGRFTCAQNRADAGRPALSSFELRAHVRGVHLHPEQAPPPPGDQLRLRQSCFPDQR